MEGESSADDMLVSVMTYTTPNQSHTDIFLYPLLDCSSIYLNIFYWLLLQSLYFSILNIDIKKLDSY